MRRARSSTAPPAKPRSVLLWRITVGRSPRCWTCSRDERRVTMRLDAFLGCVEGVRRNGSGWSAKCPAHDDQTASLSVGEGADGTLLLKCHAGCGFQQILAAVGSPLRAHPGEIDAHLHTRLGSRILPRRTLCKPVMHISAYPLHTPRVCTLAAYAELKQLPELFLRSVDVSEMKSYGSAKTPAVAMAYIGVDGETVTTRYRIGLAGANKMRSRGGKKMCLYGLGRLAHAREAGYLILPEGESCTRNALAPRLPRCGLALSHGLARRPRPRPRGRDRQAVRCDRA